MSFKDMFSRGQKDGEANILSDEGYALIEKCIPILEKFASRITFRPEAKTFDSYKEKLFDWVSKYGEFENEFNGFENNSFKPNNPNQILVVLTDHLNMVSAVPNIKTTIDNIANTQVSARNMCEILTFVNIMQLNRGASGDSRIRAQMFEPTDSDFRDSSVVYDGSMVVMTLFSPFKVGLKDHRHYDIEKLGDRYVSLKVLKNRFGSANIRDALAFYGEVNLYKELPSPDEIFDYEIYKHPDWLIKTDDINSKPLKTFVFNE